MGPHGVVGLHRAVSTEVLRADVGGVPVGHWSWDDVRDLVQTARTHTKAAEHLWLDQLND